ncbi:SHC-transforming protein 1-like isoform X2 [Branchiostoma lanceolatum]|uniref:SHC-transforming protein 1-like isoform X2 n=1 Tax=Branchiostoma lanceolatum TaxID=7740 RepID=UPI003456EC2C
MVSLKDIMSRKVTFSPPTSPRDASPTFLKRYLADPLGGDAASRMNYRVMRDEEDASPEFTKKPVCSVPDPPAVQPTVKSKPFFKHPTLAAMAGVINKLRNKNKPPITQQAPGWTSSGSFINKPTRGWLHNDDTLKDGGVCYGVKYMGCMEIKQSMRTLHFETRTQVTREAICRVCESVGIKLGNRKRKVSKDLTKILGSSPNLQFSNSNINLTITTVALNLLIMETGEVIANHHMQSISFASGGDPETQDYVAYVAKDPVNSRACHVLHCPGGLAQDVITTIGQAFELRFKDFLKNPPKAVSAPDRLEDPIFEEGESAWGDDPEYYNEIPGKLPPTGGVPPPLPAGPPPGHYQSPSNLQASDGVYSSVKDAPRRGPGPTYDNKASADNLIDFTAETPTAPVYDNPLHEPAGRGPLISHGNNLPPEVSQPRSEVSLFDDPTYDNSRMENRPAQPAPMGAQQPHRPPPPLPQDPFNMGPFDAGLQQDPLSAPNPPQDSPPHPLYEEEWFHGPMTRKQAEELLEEDGDFLVRESTTSQGQYVLSGMQEGRVKHLLLVDPQGVVRTKDRTFDSVSHLISYHRDNQLPIISAGSAVRLLHPVLNSNSLMLTSPC